MNDDFLLGESEMYSFASKFLINFVYTLMVIKVLLSNDDKRDFKNPLRYGRRYEFEWGYE